MFLFSQDRYFFLSGFTTYFLVLLNLGSSPVQPLLSSDTLQTTKAFFISLLISFPLFQSSCILNILIQLPQIARFFHFTVTVTCTTWFSHSRIWTRCTQLHFSLSYLLNGFNATKKGLQNGNSTLAHPFFSPFSRPPAFLYTSRSDKLQLTHYYEAHYLFRPICKKKGGWNPIKYLKQQTFNRPCDGQPHCFLFFWTC